MAKLLSPVGDFECLKAAVQNGADEVYFGSNLFSARAFATNFDDNELEKAINYAKIRGVKTHLTLNTLIKDDEFEDAINVAKTAYEFGIDAIIVQDLGLATTLIKNFPDIEIHASTQMTTSNLEGVKKLQELGFKRIVLSRECSLSEIKHICKNSDVDIEVFIHGALCICYSGQCLFSSMVGGRSGNRGKCAQPCRLPYSLYSKNSPDNILDNGYILSPRDLCSLENLPELISCGVASFKIEGRMKSPTYVATVTKIYRKYIDLATKYINNEIDKYEIDNKDKSDLVQVFNRGNFSAGHLLDEPNKNLIFSQKPNNMGIYLGKIIKYSPNRGLITVKLENNVSIGDNISFQNENTKYTISELMINKNNVKSASSSQIVTFGRMKGNIKINDKIFKITDKQLSLSSLKSYEKESIKTPLYCKLEIKSNLKIKVYVKSLDFNIEDKFEYDNIPSKAQSASISIDKIKDQFNKTLNTCFKFSNIDIDLDDNLFIPTSILNDIRRQSIYRIECKILKSFKRKSNFILDNKIIKNLSYSSSPKKAVLLNILDISYDYSKLQHVDRIYIPLKYFCNKKYDQIIKILSQKSKIYIYLPVVIKDRFMENIHNSIIKAYKNYNISGFVISEISSLDFLKKQNTDLIANYNFNIFNSFTAMQVKDLGFSTVTLSPELENRDLLDINFSEKEIIVYGKIPLMTMSYCLLGKSNRCYSKCSKLCQTNSKFYIKDRYNFTFRVVPDNIQTLTTIYNSRNISISNSVTSYKRFDFLDETIEEINTIINRH